MRRGLRYLPGTPVATGHRGRRFIGPRAVRGRLGLLGLGLLATLTMVWQQQATLASFVDADSARSTFTAMSLPPKVATTFEPTASTIKAAWPKADSSWDWATPQYTLDWSASGSGAGTRVYDGIANTATHTVGSGTQSAKPVAFTAVAAGATHACGVARGTVYCWGTSAYGLGLGATTQAVVPTPVTGGDLGTKPVTAVAAGTDFTCALAEGRAYCWGVGANGQLGIGGQTAQSTPKLVSALTSVTAITAGTAHACAIAAGKAYCWGQGSNGQIGDGGTSQKESPTAVKTDQGALVGRTVASISAGGAHTCAVADGQASCWGNNASGQLGVGSTTQSAVPVAVSTASHLMGRTVSQVSTGAAHSCALADSKVYCWGLGTSGQLGNSASATSSVPVPVTSLSGVTQLSSGAHQTCAVAGGLSCWGANIANAPVSYTGSISGRSVTAVSLGTDYGCVTALNAPAACAGDGTGYRLGTGSTAATTSFSDVALSAPRCPDQSVRISPTECSLLQGTQYSYKVGYSIGTWTAPGVQWTSASTTTRTGSSITAAAASTTVNLSWGAAAEAGDSYAEYTVERRRNSADAPVTLGVTGGRTWTDAGGVDPTRDFAQVSAGSSHTCGIVDQRLYCWGQNDKGQLGNGSTTSTASPSYVMGNVVEVTAGASHTCARTTDGSAYCWGDNGSGQLGVGSTTSTNSPQRIPGYTFTDLSAGGSHTCGVSGGDVYCWGLNSSGQLGLGNTTAYATPQLVDDTLKCQGGVIAVFLCQLTGQGKSPVFTNGTVTAVAAGTAHSCVLSGGSAFCWGQNADGQLGLGDTTTTSSADKVGNGAMTNSSLQALSAGGQHTCAVRSGTAYCWGSDSSGQLGSTSTSTRATTPVAVATVTGVTAVSAGTTHTCAIASGAAWCWGSQANGRLGNGLTTGSALTPVRVTANGALTDATVASVTAGDKHSCLVADGTAYCWGSSSSGRLGRGGPTTDNGDYPLAQRTDGDVRCAVGSNDLGDGTCSLASGDTYEYRVTFTLDGTTSTPGPWKSVTLG